MQQARIARRLRRWSWAGDQAELPGGFVRSKAKGNGGFFASPQLKSVWGPLCSATVWIVKGGLMGQDAKESLKKSRGCTPRLKPHSFCGPLRHG
jgi:hypothetical protein